MTLKNRSSLKKSVILLIIALLGIIPFTVSANEDSIVDIAVADGRFTTLVTAVQAAGLAEMLDQNGPFTVFAPTDDAFGKLPSGTVEGLLGDTTALRQILLYHLVQGDVSAEQVVTLNQATTALGKDISFAVRDGSVYLNDNVRVVITDIQAKNGVIHVIDTVLLPPSVAPAPATNSAPATTEPTLQSIVGTAVTDGRFTTLVAAAQAAGLADMLDQNGPFTLFAPTDDAFAKLPAGTVEELLADADSLRQILLYHVVQGRFAAEQVVGLNGVTTALGKRATIDASNGVVINGESNVIITDIETSNGIIHVIDTVLLPPAGGFIGEAAPAAHQAAAAAGPSIVDIAVADGRFTTLVSAVQAAGLADMLSNNGPFTVFAPTDDAFAKLPAGTIEALLGDPTTLRQILLYHIVQGEVKAEQVVGLQEASTALGQNISIDVHDGVVLNGNVKVIITDIEAANGVIHVIDTVLLPPGG